MRSIIICHVVDTYIYIYIYIYMMIYIYNPPNNLCGLSFHKTDHVIQNRAMDIRGYPSSDFILTEGKPRIEQTFTLNFELVKENQKKKFLQKPVTDK